MVAYIKQVRRPVMIDDEPVFVSMLTEMLGSLGYEVRVSADARFSDIYEIKDSDIVFVDALMPHASGSQVLEQMAVVDKRQGVLKILHSKIGEQVDTKDLLAEIS